MDISFPANVFSHTSLSVVAKLQEIRCLLRGTRCLSEHHLSRRLSIGFFQESWRLGSALPPSHRHPSTSADIAAPAYSLNTVLQARHASCAPEKSLGFSSKRVSTPTPVACVPRRRSTLDFVSECCKLVRCLAVCSDPAHSAIPCSAWSNPPAQS